MTSGRVGLAVGRNRQLSRAFSGPISEVVIDLDGRQT